MIIRTGIGQDSHRFLSPESIKPFVLGGIIFDGVPGLAANSDGDVIFHSICNAITSLTGVLILGGAAEELCSQGITDSHVYVKEALKHLKKQKITHIALTIEGKRPFIKDKIIEIRKNIAKVMNLDITQTGLTATTGETLTNFGLGEGIQCFCIITTMEEP